ncbi:hypothetical protein E2320_010492, partial [Naja naja]
LCSGGSSSPSTAAASRKLWKEEEGTKERLLPGLRPTARTVLAPRAAFLPAKPFRRQAELSGCPIQFLPPHPPAQAQLRWLCQQHPSRLCPLRASRGITSVFLKLLSAAANKSGKV